MLACLALPFVCVGLHGEPPVAAPRPSVDGVTPIDPGALAALRSRPRGVGARRLLRVDGFPLGEGVVRPLLLEERSALSGDFRVEVESIVADGAVATRALPVPPLRLYGGSVEGIPGSVAWIAVWDDPDVGDSGADASGDHSFLCGFIRIEDGVRLIASPPARARRRGGLPAVVFDPARHPHAVATDPADFCGLQAIPGAEDHPSTGTWNADGIAGTPVCRELSVALDTDTSFTRDLFDHDVPAAAAYAIALVSAVSEIAERDAGTRLRLRYLRLRDPAASDVPPITASALQADWRANMRHVPRDFVHSLSGGASQSGEAFLGALCSEAVFGGDSAFGSSRGLTGAFPYPLPDFDPGTFDVFLVGHEIGHTLGAPHTFESSPSFETCGSSTSNCPPGATGSLMSYCALCPGGTANIALRYHPISAGYIEAKFAMLPCDYTGGDAPIARDDVVRSLGAEPVDAPVLLNDRGSGCSEAELAWHASRSALGCTVESVVGADGRAALRIHPVEGIEGTDVVGYGIVDASGASAAGLLVVEWMPPLPATTVLGASPGLSVEAFDTGEILALPDLESAEPFLVATVEQPSFTVGVAQPVPPTSRIDRVALRYQGWLSVPSTDLWKLVLISDAGSRLWIDDRLVVDHDGIHAATRKTGYAGLAAGRHSVRIEYFEDTGAARLTLRWSRPGIAEANIPSSACSRGGVGLQPDIDGDGVVGSRDLASLLSAWGACVGCVEDIDRNGSVDASDLTLLLDAWDPAP